jgi:hypothetical protein
VGVFDRTKLARDARRERAYERLGTRNPRCGCCGKNDWRVLELHHPSRRAHDAAFVIIMCANCHKQLSDEQKDHAKCPTKTQLGSW